MINAQAQKLNPIISAMQIDQTKNFGELYDIYVKSIYDFIYFKTHHRETAEDLTSQTFLKAYENFENFNPDIGSFKSWVYRIAQNTVIDYYRTNKASIKIDDIWDLKAPEDIEQDFDTKQQLEKAKTYLSKLPRQERDIMIMRVWQELSYKEIAEIVEKSENACKMSFCRAISKLRKEIPLSLLFLLLIS